MAANCPATEEKRVLCDDADDAQAERQAKLSPRRELRPDEQHGARPSLNPKADGRPRGRHSVGAGEAAAMAATAAKLKICMNSVQELKEGFRSVRRDHVLRAEMRREQQAQTRLEQHQEDIELRRSLVSTFSSRKLSRLKKKMATRHENSIQTALRSYEQNKKFLELPKQDQLKQILWRRGVSARELKKYLDEELEQEGACIGLVVAVLMMVFFCLGMFSHMRMEEAHSEDHAVNFDVHDNTNFDFIGSIPFENGRVGLKDITNVNTIPEFWSWMNLGVVPRLLPEEGGWETAEPRQNAALMCSTYRGALAAWEHYGDGALDYTTDTTGIYVNMNFDSGCPEEETAQPSWPEGFLGPEGQQAHPYLYYHAIVGGIRMQQVFTQVTECPDQTFYQRLFSGKCVPAWEPDYRLEPEPAQAIFSNGETFSRKVFLKTHTSQPDLREQLRKLEDQAWLSPQTAKVEIIYTTYNPMLNSLTVTFLNMFLNRAGHMHKVIEPMTIFLQPYEFWYDTIWEVLWLLLLAKLVIDEIRDIYDHIKHNRVCWTGLKKYVSVGNLIDWLNIVHSLVICGLWGLYNIQIWNLNAMLRTADVTVQGSWRTDEERNDFYDQSIAVCSRQYYLRRVAAAYPLVVIFKFLKVCSYSPRLALMTDTLSKASVDIFHFAVVFFTVFIIYTISAIFLFGEEVLSFSTPPRAIDSTFKIVMGHFDFQELIRIGRTEAFVWFLSFTLLVNLIMLNMLLAIIMDVYTEVKSSLSQDAETLWSQMYQVLERKWDVYYRRTRVSLKTIRSTLGLRGDFEGNNDTDPSPDELDFIRYVAMSPVDEDEDEVTMLEFAVNLRIDDDSLEFEKLGCDLFVKSVSESGADCAVRLKDDSTQYDRTSDEAKFEPCYEGWQVTRVTAEHDLEVTDAQDMLDVIHQHRTMRQSVIITINKTPETIDDGHDIEGLTNVLKSLKLTTAQAKIVIEEAARHAEESLKDGASISDTNTRIAKISDILEEVKALARDNLFLAQPHLVS